MKQMLLKARNGLLASAMVGLLMAGWSVSASAQNCTTGNWTSVVGLVNGENNATGNVGSPPAFRRYAGPCALKVPVNGVARYVTDETPNSETSYIARFYMFLDNVGQTPIQVFGASDGQEDQIQVWYNSPSPGNLTLRVFDANGAEQVLAPFTDVAQRRWHSIELVWDAAASANIRFSLNGQADRTASVNTTGLGINAVFLGNVNGADGTGAIDFDDFDSRRTTRPGKLCRGSTVNLDQVPNTITQSDMLQIFREVLSGGSQLAQGQPDYLGNGSVTQADFLQVFANHVLAGNSACPE